MLRKQTSLSSRLTQTSGELCTVGSPVPRSCHHDEGNQFWLDPSQRIYGGRWPLLHSSCRLEVHWRRETLDDLMLACLVDVQFDQLTHQQMIGRLTDALMWLEMGTCISIHLSTHPSHLFTLSLYLSSITICLSSSITIYLSSLTICLPIYHLSVI